MNSASSPLGSTWTAEVVADCQNTKRIGLEDEVLGAIKFKFYDEPSKATLRLDTNALQGPQNYVAEPTIRTFSNVAAEKPSSWFISAMTVFNAQWTTL